MPIDPSDLPDDIEALKALVLAQRESIALMERALAVRSMEIEQLNLQLAKTDMTPRVNRDWFDSVSQFDVVPHPIS